jgi:hypothetical protein
MRRSLASTQDNVQSRLEQIQDFLLAGLIMAQDALEAGGKNVKRANKNWRRAQKRMKRNLASVQDSVQSGLERTQAALQAGLTRVQDALAPGRKKVKPAGVDLKKAQAGLKGARAVTQYQLAKYARRRRQARILFRLGLLTGLVLVLLYTPWPGSDIRRQLAAWWEQLISRQG